ncbi:hypothetical protein PLESTM_000918700 [Pleodorina starrii]|nr:hypothetical protein PLESTM_000918700 [Pleodorina starrii]
MESHQKNGGVVRLSGREALHGALICPLSGLLLCDYPMCDPEDKEGRSLECVAVEVHQSRHGVRPLTGLPPLEINDTTRSFQNTTVRNVTLFYISKVMDTSQHQQLEEHLEYARPIRHAVVAATVTAATTAGTSAASISSTSAAHRYVPCLPKNAKVPIDLIDPVTFRLMRFPMFHKDNTGVSVDRSTLEACLVLHYKNPVTGKRLEDLSDFRPNQALESLCASYWVEVAKAGLRIYYEAPTARSRQAEQEHMADGGMAVNTGPAVSGRAGNSAAASLGKSFTPAVAVGALGAAPRCPHIAAVPQRQQGQQEQHPSATSAQTQEGECMAAADEPARDAAEITAATRGAPEPAVSGGPVSGTVEPGGFRGAAASTQQQPAEAPADNSDPSRQRPLPLPQQVLAGASSVFLAGSGGSVKQGEDASADDNNRPTTGSGTAAAGQVCPSSQLTHLAAMDQRRRAAARHHLQTVGQRSQLATGGLGGRGPHTAPMGARGEIAGGVRVQVPNTAPTANREAPVLSSKTQGVRSKPPVIGSQDPAASNLLPSSLGKRATPASGEVPLEAGNAPPSVMGGKALEEGHQQTAASGDAQAPAAGGGQDPLPRPQSAAVGSCTLVPGGQEATAAAAGGLTVTATGGSTALLGEMGQTLAGGGQQQQQQQDAAGGGNALVAGSHSPVEADQAQAARLPPHGAPMLTGQLLEEKQVLQAVMLLRQHRHQQHRQLLQHQHPHHHQKQQGQHQQQR